MEVGKLKTIYVVQAYDINAKKVVIFNRMLTTTQDEAFKFAKHLRDELKHYYKDIKLITETYELKKKEVLEFKEEI